MSTVAMSGERVRVWRVVPTVVHPDADVDVSAIEPETGLTQRDARELRPSVTGGAYHDQRRVGCQTD